MASSYLEAPLRTEAEVLAAVARRRNDRAAAIRWAMLEIAPLTEGPRQALEAIAGATTAKAAE